MISSSIRSGSEAVSFSFNWRKAFGAGLGIAALLAATVGVRAQDAAPAATPDAAAQSGSAQSGSAQSGSAQSGAATGTISLSNQKAPKVRKQKEDKVILSKATKKAVKKDRVADSLVGVDEKIPDKELYDKAEDAVKHGRYDVARLDLQTLLNTYPDSQYMMRAKLAVADSWYKEGGTAALAQAEQEYKDFITFFPNSPEAAEAQMRVGDIYFRQMDKPDRDYTTAMHAEEEYRLGLQEFPDSPLVPQASQRLREVQETLAYREATVGKFYAAKSPPNLPAAIARYQTVVDTYPLYSGMDDVLVGLGDAYETEARIVRMYSLPEAAKAQLEKIYDDQAIAAYSKVILEHSAAAHVEDARDRLVGMGVPVPVPTAEQAAASAALENSRGQYTLSKRAVGLFMNQADTVPAATIGAPPLEDAKPTYAPTVVTRSINDFNMAVNPAAYPQQAAVAAPAVGDGSAAVADPGAAAPGGPIAFQDVPAAGAGGAPSGAVSSVAATVPAAAVGGGGVGVEIVQPSANTPAPGTGTTTFPGSAAPAGDVPQPDGTAAVPGNGGLRPEGPAATAALAPVEKAAPAPDAINDVAPGSQPSAQTAPANGKTPKPVFDKADESSSKHKKKKGLSKLNPF